MACVRSGTNFTIKVISEEDRRTLWMFCRVGSEVNGLKGRPNIFFWNHWCICQNALSSSSHQREVKAMRSFKDFWKVRLIAMANLYPTWICKARDVSLFPQEHRWLLMDIIDRTMPQRRHNHLEWKERRRKTRTMRVRQKNSGNMMIRSFRGMELLTCSMTCMDSQLE